MAIQHVLLFLAYFALAEVYEKTNPDVFFLNTNNFDKQVTKKRDKFVSIVHFYRNRDGKSKAWAQEIKELAQDWQGVYNIGVVNCDANEKLCENQDIRSTPLIKIIPPMPMPIQEYEGEVTAKAINNYCSRFVKSLVIDLTEENWKTFLDEKPSMPKVILFTEKSGTPTLFKALSVTFESKMLFGIARPDDKGLIQKFKVKSYPKIVMYKTSSAKTFDYSGDLKFRGIFDWLNVHSETFVTGGSDEVLSIKPWMNQPLPQLFKQSADDICFKFEGYLCAILFLNSPPDEKTVSVFKGLSEKYSAKKERGADVKFMWLDVGSDKGFFDSFEGVKVGQVALLKHGKRSKFALFEDTIDAGKLSELIEKIATGEGKFTAIKGGLPELSNEKK
jgi:hypothetical protein